MGDGQQTGKTSEPAASDGVFSIEDEVKGEAGFYRVLEKGAGTTGP